MTAHQLPAGPKGVLRSTWGVIRNPRDFFCRCVATYGDPFLITAMNGPVVITGQPDLVEQIFRAPPDTFGVFAKNSLVPLLGAGSLLLMEGPKHRSERKRIAPPLHGSCMRAYGKIMQETAQNSIAKYESGATFTGLQIGTDISLEVILKAILGADTTRLLEDFRQSTRKVLSRSWPILFFSPKTQISFLGLSPIDRLRTAQRELRGQLRTELERRGDEINDRDDLLSILARSTSESPAPEFEELADSIGTLMFAGHETTAVSIAWAFYFLLRHPEWLHRLREELDASDGQPETYATMPLLDAIIHEVLRLNPIVPEVLRIVREPFQLGGYEIPVGHGVAAAGCLTHYDPDIFQSPHEFNPQRFLDRTYKPSEYFPFGGGTRVTV